MRHLVSLMSAALCLTCRFPWSVGLPAAATATVPAGTYRVGSSAQERELAYRLSPAGVREQRWYDAWEAKPHSVSLGPVWIDRVPVTQAAYAEFVRATRRAPPHIGRSDYQKQGFLVHPYETVGPYLWHAGEPPRDRADHPVVLVDRSDAQAYCAWRGGRLPSDEEWEAACRGREGRLFPWGDTWKDGAAQVESAGTAPVRAHPAGRTPRRVWDLAGNVFEWTRSNAPDGRALLKGCSWDDAPGSCRCAFRHPRPATSRHILIGFRCVHGP